MKERSLIAFTVLSQMAVGAFWTLGALHAWASRQAGVAAAEALTDRAWLAVGPVMVLAMLASFFHLGTPFKAWRALANLRSSWLSREILFTVTFTGVSGLFAGLQWFKPGNVAVRVVIGWAAALLGLWLIVSMASAYRLRTVPAWNTWVTPVSFLTTTLLLGGLAAGALLMANQSLRGATAPPELLRSLLERISLGAAVLLGIELAIIPLWIARLAAGQGAALRAAAKMTQEHSLIFRLRLALAVLSLAAAGLALSPWREGATMDWATILSFGLALISKVLGRGLFYEARVRHGV